VSKLAPNCQGKKYNSAIPCAKSCVKSGLFLHVFRSSDFFLAIRRKHDLYKNKRRRRTNNFCLRRGLSGSSPRGRSPLWLDPDASERAQNAGRFSPVAPVDAGHRVHEQIRRASCEDFLGEIGWQELIVSRINSVSRGVLNAGMSRRNGWYRWGIFLSIRESRVCTLPTISCSRSNLWRIIFRRGPGEAFPRSGGPGTPCRWPERKRTQPVRSSRILISGPSGLIPSRMTDAGMTRIASKAASTQYMKASSSEM
jgi:hypothetical protein